MANVTTVPLAIIIPVFNEGTRFEAFVGTLLDFFSERKPAFPHVHIVCVDDGSKEPVRLPGLPVPETVQIHLLRHKVNFGQGAALQTGIEFARDIQRCRIFATMDSDGQHSVKDLPRMLAELENGRADIVFGTRFSEDSESNVPLSRKRVLRLAILFENFITGVKSSDAHNGYRVFNSKFAEAVNLKQNKMAHATEFKLIVKKYKFPYAEVPVSISYSPENMAKGQRNTGAFLIIRDLLRMLIFDRG